jgi:hypothetical protein
METVADLHKRYKRLAIVALAEAAGILDIKNKTMPVLEAELIALASTGVFRLSECCILCRGGVDLSITSIFRQGASGAGHRQLLADWRGEGRGV